jgi:hypothetical protein
MKPLSMDCRDLIPSKEPSLFMECFAKDCVKILGHMKHKHTQPIPVSTIDSQGFNGAQSNKFNSTAGSGAFPQIAGTNGVGKAAAAAKDKEEVEGPDDENKPVKANLDT